MPRRRLILLLGALYFAQGLPYGFFTQALPVLLREAGYSLTAISATGMLFLPWAIKFLWAPWVDHRGSRRDWLLPLQIGVVLLALVLSGMPLEGGFVVLFVALFLFNILSATQDIATDGLAVQLLSSKERGLGNGLQVGGYRLGMILGGGLLLWLYAQAGWAMMLWTMAGLLILTIPPVLSLQEPPCVRPATPPAQKELLWTWWARLRRPGMFGFIGLIAAYKFGDTMAAAHIGPMMVDLGLSTADIAIIKGTIGSAMALAGSALGGWVAWTLPRRTTMLLCGLLQAASLLPFIAAAAGIAILPMLWLGAVVESLCGAMATVALFTLMMDAAETEHGGTDYTLLASVIVLVMGLALFAGGVVGDALGYQALLSSGLAGSVAGCLFLVWRLDRGSDVPGLREVWAGKAAVAASKP